MTIDATDGQDLATLPVERPRPARLLWYSVGGSLPRRHSSWVLHDLTCSTWVLRHYARTFLFVVPLFGLYMALVPASFGVRLYTGLTFAAGLVVISTVLILIDGDRRAGRAGFRFGLLPEVRSARSVERQRVANHQRRERIAARRARR